MLDDAALQRMTLTAYEAATDASRWHVLMEDLQRNFHASTACIFTPVVGANQRLLSAAAGMDASAQALIAEWVPKDPWLQTRLEQRLPMDKGLVVVGSEYLPWQKLERTQFYNECGRHVGVKGLVTLIVEGDRGQYGIPRTHLALSRPPGMGEFEEHEAAFLKALWKPLRNALQSYFALEQIHALSRSVEETFESIPQPTLVLDGDASVVFGNRASRALLTQSGVLRASQERITAVGNLAGERWSSILRAAMAGLYRPTSFWWSTSDGNLHTGLLQLGRFRATGPVSDHWARARLVLVLELDDPACRRRAVIAGLAQTYRLTPGEMRVLERLAEGMRPEAIARAEAIAITTVRTHISHLLQKTGAAGTSDLVRLLGG
jgi:DNA-binding CsgD family transcriptional regulator